jgi:hypothetical protein
VQADIVLVDPIARRDMRLRKADDLAKLHDRLALADRQDGHLVAFMIFCRAVIPCAVSPWPTTSTAITTLSVSPR